jgi:hypothetical protein
MSAMPRKPKKLGVLALRLDGDALNVISSPQAFEKVQGAASGNLGRTCLIVAQLKRLHLYTLLPEDSLCGVKPLSPLQRRRCVNPSVAGGVLPLHLAKRVHIRAACSMSVIPR